MQRVFSSSFLRGLNSDLNRAITPAGNYIAANDLTLTGDSLFLSATNIGGTSKVGQLIASFTGSSTVLGVFANKYKIDGVSGIECLTIFTAVPSGNFTIYCFRLDTQAVLTLYSESFTSAFATSLPVMDAIVYPENNIDILYFTDGYSELRKLRCDISTPYTVTSSSLSLQRRGTLADVSLYNVPESGTLLAGSYQFSVRYYNSTTGAYSKWTIPTTPILVTKGMNDYINSGTAGYNTVTKKQIDIQISSYASIIADYTHYQVAVIESIGSVPATIASLQPIQAIDVTAVFSYKSNTKIGDIPLSDIVVDLAAIETAKTLAIKNNRIFPGNVTYWNRDYDRTPTATGTVSVSGVTSNLDDTQTSSRKGYFRNEVYRFYISYYDDYYNFSRPTRLNMNAITANQIANGDIKFPKGRGGSWHVTGSNIGGDIFFQYLNLSLTINNHPSWAKGFVILRAKRKKRVEFQTPIIPMCLVEGIDTMGQYPNTVNISDGAGATTSKTLASATPMNSAGTYMPKNLFWSENRDIKKFKQDHSSGKKGEVYYEVPIYGSPLHCVFPQSTIYDTQSATNTPYDFKSGHLLESIDVAFLKATKNDYTQTGVTAGDTCFTSVNSVFYANYNDYYFTFQGTEGVSPLADIDDQSSKINSYKVLDNYGEGTTMNGKYVGMFSNLDTNGLTWYQKPNNQKMGVIETTSYRNDAAEYHGSISTNLGGTPNDTVPPGYYSTSSPMTPLLGPLTSSDPSAFVINKAGFTAQSTYATMVEIANIVNQNGDDRYGSADQLHDLVFTGASHVFNPSDISSIISTGNVPITLTVAGGDCFVSHHAFKLTDNHYMVSNSGRVNKSPAAADGGVTLLNKWTYSFNTASNTVAITVPVGGKNISQVVRVIIESEYNGETTGPCPYPTSAAFGNMGIMDSTEEGNWRTAFGYPYNQGLLQASDQKSFTPFNANEIITTEYPSRVLFSDEKIYNTDISGFDIFRVASFVDLEDTYRGVTKLALSGDQLIAIQAKAAVFLPIDANVIGTADTNTLSIRSGEVIGVPQYISRQYGSQHLKSVIAQDNFIIFTDNINKSVLRLAGQEIQNISDNGVATAFRTLLATSVPQNSLYSIYDNKNRQYIIYQNDGTFAYVWDDRLQLWTGTQSYSSQCRLYDGVYFNNYAYLLGRNASNNLNVYKAYEGTPGQLFGNIITPSITVSVNDEFDIAKTFDNFIIYSSDKLDTADITAEREPSVITQEVLNQDIEVSRREGAYRVAVLRDSDNARIRGTRANVKLKWVTLTSHNEDSPTVVDKVSLAKINTKYRLSARNI